MMMKSILDEFLQQPQGPSVSIVVSTPLKSFDQKKKVQLKLKNAVRQSEKALSIAYDEETVKKMMRLLKSAAKQVDLNHWGKGIGIYISPTFQKIVSFPLVVQDVVHVGDSFDTSAIDETMDKMIDYTVILLSKNKTRLFEGQGNQLKEVIDDNFPQHLQQEFQISRPDPHSYYNTEESEVDQARLNDYFRKIDGLLDNYISGKRLIILGVVKNLSDFKSVSKHVPLIITQLSGNFDNYKLHEISQLVWPQMEEYLEKV